MRALYFHYSACLWKCESCLKQMKKKEFSPYSAQDYRTLQEGP